MPQKNEKNDLKNHKMYNKISYSNLKIPTTYLY